MAEYILFQEIKEMKPQKISTLDTQMRQALILRYLAGFGPLSVWQLYMTLRLSKVARLSRMLNLELRHLTNCASILSYNLTSSSALLRIGRGKK